MLLPSTIKILDFGFSALFHSFVYTQLLWPIWVPTEQWYITRVSVASKITCYTLTYVLNCGTYNVYNTFIMQWYCSLMWGPNQWNIGYYLIVVVSTHPFRAYEPGNIVSRLFCSNCLSLLVPRLWPDQSWLSNNSTPWWAVILVMDAIRRDFELNSSFSFLFTHFYRWCVVALVLIMDTPVSLW